MPRLTPKGSVRAASVLTLFALLPVSFLVPSPQAQAHKPDGDRADNRWVGKRPVYARPVGDGESIDYSVVLENLPQKGKTTKLEFRRSTGGSSLDAWLYGRLESDCPSADAGCLKQPARQVGKDNRLGGFAASYSTAAEGFVVELEWPVEGSYHGFLRILDGDLLVIAFLHVDVVSNTDSSDRSAQISTTLPLSVLGRAARDRAQDAPPWWLKPTAYMLLALLASGGLWLALTTPGRMARRRPQN